MIENNLLSIIIFAPLVGAVINWLIGGRLKNELFSGFVACGAIAISTVFAFYLAFVANGGALFIEKPILDHLWTWISVGNFRADFGLGMDRLSALYVCFVTFVGLLIHIFATGYMHQDKGFYRFFAYMNLFMFSMLTLILADNFLLMFVGWEGVGLCSYLLIGYYIQQDEARRAAKKAFVMNRIGDWGVLMGVFLIFTLTGSISFYDKAVDGTQIQSVFTWIGANITQAEPFTISAIFAGGLTSAALLLFIGATGKSAQIPLFTWLPDAMAGPTPVSALIHAATMVTAGVYMVVRCNSIYQNAPTAMLIVAIIGCATAIFAATIGLAQNDIKKVLAYSTVSQLGYMFLACGVGAFIAAIFHVITHAFFKALLFLGSGSVIHGMHHEQDMRKMGGLRKYMPITFATMITGWLAICGIPIWAGFFSKDEILYKTFAAAGLPQNANYILWVIGLVTAVLTAVYMTRLMIMTFWGEPRFASGHQGHHHEQMADHSTHEESHNHTPHESPWVMTLPLIVLAILSTFGGLIGVPYALSGGAIPNVIEKTLEPVIAHAATKEAHHTGEGHEATEKATPLASEHEKMASDEHHSPEELATERLLAGLSVLLAVAGIGIAFFLFGKQPLRKLPRILEEKWRIDEIYNGFIVDPITKFSRSALWKGFDLGFIDGIVNGIGYATVEIGSAIRKLQVGYVRAYAAFILFGALIVVGYFIYYGLKLIG
ncbi:MAG TPA: NADH-quinone oxidoreductase subunit L [Pyrinomonadaceae bacterium]|nr:NADH-quinone oxidoreductase subunit L [Pyrinomonadaceae bacterium]